MSSPSIQRLFSSIHNPLEAQALFNTWRSGLQAEVERLTPAMLPTALLAANVALLSFKTQIVDDYERLFERVREEYARDIPRFWHPEGFLVSALAFKHGSRSDYDVSEVRDAQYVHQAVKIIFDL
jgi:hypothetical protein